MSVYFDHNTNSPLHPEVLDAMMPFLREGAANASSLHSAGRLARSAIEAARGHVVVQIAALEIEHKRYYLEQLRGVLESRLLAIPALVNKLPAIIRQAAG